ncbi:TRAP transporter small permease [Roseinatronobacter sp.]
MQLLRGLSRILDLMVWLIYALSCLAMAALVVMAGWQVWGRYVMNNSPTWTEQLTMLLLLYITLPLAAVGLREGFHLAVEILPNKLYGAALRWQQRGTMLCLGFFGWFMMTAGWDLTMRTWAQALPLIGISRGYTYLPLVVSGVLTLIFVTEFLIWSFTAVGQRPRAKTVFAPGAQQEVL